MAQYSGKHGAGSQASVAGHCVNSGMQVGVSLSNWDNCTQYGRQRGQSHGDVLCGMHCSGLARLCVSEWRMGGYGGEVLRSNVCKVHRWGSLQFKYLHESVEDVQRYFQARGNWLLGRAGLS